MKPRIEKKLSKKLALLLAGTREYSGIWVDAEYYRHFSQDRIASYETETGGYNMVNATLAYRLDLTARQQAEFYLRGTNLLNETAYVHTSFVKDQSPLRGRSLTMGLRYTF